MNTMNFLFLTAAVMYASTTVVHSQQATNAPSSVPTSVNNIATTTAGAPSLAPMALFEVVSDTPSKVPTQVEAVPPSASPVPVLATSIAPFTTAPVPVFVPVALPPVVTSDLCELNPACAALNLTGQCCPTIDEQFLYCCNGFIEPTCESNDKCSDLGLVGACCPTAGNIPSEFDGVYLDCCSSVPDECATNTDNSTDTPGCKQRSAVEFRAAVNEFNSASPSITMGSGVVMFIALMVTGLFL